MPSKTPIGIFLAAAAALSTNAIIPENSMAGEKHGDMGGLKEWTLIKKQTRMASLTKPHKKLRIKLKNQMFASLLVRVRTAGKA